MARLSVQKTLNRTLYSETVKVSAISIYPIKGMGSQLLEHALVERRGLRFDRRWMLVDSDGVFLSQRKVGRMATLIPYLLADGLRVSAPDRAPIVIPLEPVPIKRRVTVWRSELDAYGYGDEIDQWFSSALEMPCALVKMEADSIRTTNPDFSLPGDEVSFADGYPVTLASESSLSDLNGRLERPVPMNRFRPNIVIEGIKEPWIEESWARVQVGQVWFRVAKPCGRCLVTTIDQQSGESTGAEPLRTLAVYRRKQSTADFSINLIPERDGAISVGDVITPWPARS